MQVEQTVQPAKFFIQAIKIEYIPISAKSFIIKSTTDFTTHLRPFWK